MAQAMQSGPMGMLAQANPQMQQVQKYIQDHGGNAEQAFLQLARERGLNPDDILSQVRAMFGVK